MLFQSRLLLLYRALLFLFLLQCPLHILDLSLECHDFSLASVHVYFVILEFLTRLFNVNLELIEFFQKVLGLLRELLHIFACSIILLFVLFSLLDFFPNGGVDLALKLVLDITHLLLVHCHGFLVLLFSLFIDINLLLDLLPDFLVGA